MHHILEAMATWRKQIQKKRRGFFTALTRTLEKTRIPDLKEDKPFPVRRVLVIRPNHRLGNQLLITPLLQEIEHVLPDARVDVWVKGGVGTILFREYGQVDNITMLPKKPARQPWRYLKGWMRLRLKRYDLVINVVNHSSSGRISTHFANARFRFLGDINGEIKEQFGDHQHIAKYPVYSFRHFIQRLGYPGSDRPVPSLDLRVTADERSQGKKLLHDIVGNDRPTIAIYTFATGDKMYSKEWWLAFYTRLKESYPDYNIVEVLPVENVSQIDFSAPSYYSKDLREIGGVVANTDIFIGADSGMMHLAVASQTPTVGLFKAPNIDIYTPYGNASCGVRINDMQIDELLDVVGKVLRSGAA